MRMEKLEFKERGGGKGTCDQDVNDIVKGHLRPASEFDFYRTWTNLERPHQMMPDTFPYGADPMDTTEMKMMNHHDTTTRRKS